jgi:predicted CXXCH cytochrome family protein
MTGWETSIHSRSPATWNGQSVDPWPHSEELTVEANACGNCHTPHAAGMGERLLTFAGEEQNCLSCHNGNVASDNIAAEIVKLSAHEVGATVGIHDPTEDLVNAPRHVECADCHNPHAAQSEVLPTGLSGSLREVAGISAAGTPVAAIQYEYELCYRCHADSLERGESLVIRQFPETNTRLEFDTGNPSYHPVVGAGRNLDVPSLIDPYQPSSVILCSDCHNNDTGPGAGSGGPNGPHGSAFPPILERRLDLVDSPGGVRPVADLCYKCHSSASILADESFSEHAKHIDKGITCTACHDSHGVRQNTHLINFNLDAAAPFSGRLEFVDTGRFSGTCTLTCHGTEHDGLSYPGTGE